MYKQHFDLERRLFRGNVAGADVFVGPQTAKILSGIKKALSGTDAVVTVTGPVGSGKSTTVAHALGAISGKNAIVRVGRFPLQRGEVLDLLFDHMRIQQRPPRGNQKLALFRQLLFNLAENDSRMFILVEDAPFLGPTILAELEVFTAADTGPSDGANIILMGDDSLSELLASKALARLRQRIRLRRKLDACSAEELGGYLTHSFRQAGGDFDKVFADGAGALLHELSGGILRVTNNLVESSMEAAAENQAKLVDLDLIARVANEEFGLTGTFAAPPQIVDDTPEPEHTDEATAELVALSLPEPAPEPLPEPEPKPEPKLEPEPEPEPTLDASEPDDDDIPELIQDTQPVLPILPEAPEAEATPELIQDTLPDLAVLSPELAQQAELPAEPEPPALALEPEPPTVAEEPAPPTTTPEPAPTAPTEKLVPTPEKRQRSDESRTPEAASPDSDDEQPDWDRDPTLAELRPDLEALERAMAVAQGRDPDADDADEPPPPVEEEKKKNAALADVPEITLDDSINRKVDAAALEQKQHDEEVGIVEEEAEPEVDAELAAKKQQMADAELEKIAEGLSQAKTIEDVDDKMAETLFGEELSIAAAAVAKRVAEESNAAAEAEPPPSPAPQAPAANGNNKSMEKEFENVWGQKPDVDVSIETQIEGQAGGMNVSASQRLATVRALRMGSNPEPGPVAPTQDAPASEPVPIEEQITTSLTQTLTALNVRPEPAAINDEPDDDDDDEKRGFFSRFRRS